MSWLRSASLILAFSVLVLGAPATSSAQSEPQRATTPSAKTGGGKQPAAAANDTAALRDRVDQLEEQLVDLQVVIGTLESLAKPPSGAAANSNDAARIQALESQLKSLSGQIEQLGAKVRGAGEPSRRTETFNPATSAAAAPTARPPEAKGQEFQPGQQLPPLGDEPAQTASEGASTVTSSTVTSSQVGQDESWAAAPAQSANQPPAAGAQQANPSESDVAALDPGSGDPKRDYEVAYSYVIQRDYGAAQAGFTDFLKRYPKDALMPNALYWLGESHYQQRNFADASEAFDLVTKLYPSSPKAADSQLKRALSLSALGKNSEACAALGQLDSSFQNAPAYVKTRAGSERRRLACS